MNNDNNTVTNPDQSPINKQYPLHGGECDSKTEEVLTNEGIATLNSETETSDEGKVKKTDLDNQQVGKIKNEPIKTNSNKSPTVVATTSVTSLPTSQKLWGSSRAASELPQMQSRALRPHDSETQEPSSDQNNWDGQSDPMIGHNHNSDDSGNSAPSDSNNSA